MQKHRPPKWPAYLIGGIGVVVVVVLLIWGGATYDSHDNPLIDTATGPILVALVTAVGIVWQQKLGRIEHEVKPNHGSSMADAINRIEGIVADVKHTQHVHSEALARLRSVPTEIGGIRRDVTGVRDDIGRLTDADAQLRQEVGATRRDLADHVKWAQQQEDRIDGLEDTLPPKKKDPS